ncbi:LacI family transcriptional regulator [Gammaproteobacteria bacterium]|nr:LacI family transcriptional regulator [Gammaproteobacteria bacterium]
MKKYLTKGFILGLAFTSMFASAQDIYIPVVSKGYQHEFWQTVKKGSEAAAKEFNIRTNFVGPADETQVAQQIQLMEDMLIQNPKAILLSSLDVNALIPIVETAHSRGIIVATFDSGIASDLPVTFVATNNRSAGAVAADEMAKLIDQKGIVGIIAHVAGTSTAIERSEGFINRMKEKYPDITVLATQYSDGDPQKAMDKTIDMIRANTGLVGIYATNEGATLGVANAIQSNKLENKIKVIGFDSTEAIIDFVNQGIIQGFIVQDPFQMGYQGIKALSLALKGEPIEKQIDVAAGFVTKENMQDPVIQKLLYPLQ